MFLNFINIQSICKTSNTEQIVEICSENMSQTVAL